MEKIPPSGGSIGHQSLWGRCPKRKRERKTNEEKEKKRKLQKVNKKNIGKDISIRKKS